MFKWSLGVLRGASSPAPLLGGAPALTLALAPATTPEEAEASFSVIPLDLKLKGSIFNNLIANGSISI